LRRHSPAGDWHECYHLAGMCESSAGQRRGSVDPSRAGPSRCPQTEIPPLWAGPRATELKGLKLAYAVPLGDDQGV